MKTWFTSDLHLGHANIIDYCDRPFSDVEDMDVKLIANWNSRVKPKDTVFHLGDFCYGNSRTSNRYINKLNGKIIFIQGNHDHNNGTNTPILDARLYHGGENLLLVHNPSDVTCFGGKLVLCGHVHTYWKFDRSRFSFEDENFTDFCNVGVDQWNFHPVNINEILQEYNVWRAKQP